MEAVENGMIVGYWKYDPQEQEQTLVHCDCCKEDVPEQETHEINGDTVCDSCLRDYCNEEYELCGSDYIKAHAKEFYLGWIFQNLSEEEQIEIIKLARLVMKNQEQQIPNNPRFLDMVEEEKEFCIQSDDWEEFVQEQLS